MFITLKRVLGSMTYVDLSSLCLLFTPSTSFSIDSMLGGVEVVWWFSTQLFTVTVSIPINPSTSPVDDVTGMWLSIDVLLPTMFLIADSMTVRIHQHTARSAISIRTMLNVDSTRPLLMSIATVTFWSWEEWKEAISDSKTNSFYLICNKII